ncbi:NUDIX hydrolase [Enterococcus dongliensis]|uniref:NUDIX hydrolase n=1 Tax=Enterococcus dongliensis TaxID=2559925 RepID=A0AAP5KS45_9ENTE|nr:NUDIX hydrolase [Enterococcus dongliensis]MDT2597147.1 NUDIX hydrolase [Enterococcus dongliensis]MDT2638100.1 NUDIX hydrolase [Enterococcus dongliensis]MDT2642952.1 NUDIX hydrolase [Enterococcus dongliensis]MDT2648260.1 NUDIX hydrolase [Enterococcus dongliensis]MDT2703533.1 NUDIX hydrolase [Enterococcus dongliensis]
MKEIIEEIQAYKPFTQQEANDQKLFLEQIQFQKNLLTRENSDYHFSSSAWVVNPTYDKVLMVYHNIYQSYSWTGGHADGCNNLLLVAQKELEEETGIKKYQLITDDLFAFDILPVQAHFKNGQFVKAHHHINTTYLFMAQEDQPLQIKADENSGVKWINVANLDQEVAEKEMQVYYHKMIQKARLLKK